MCQGERLKDKDEVGKTKDEEKLSAGTDDYKPLNTLKTWRGLGPQPMYLSRRHRDTEKDIKEILRDLRASVRDNLTYYLIGIYKYSKNKTKQKNKKLNDSITNASRRHWASSACIGSSSE